MRGVGCIVLVDNNSERYGMTTFPLSAFERALHLHTFKLIINPIVRNRKLFVAPLRSVLDEFNGLMKLSARSVVKPDLKVL
jgi:hypothetical protein